MLSQLVIDRDFLTDEEIRRPSWNALTSGSVTVSFEGGDLQSSGTKLLVSGFPEKQFLGAREATMSDEGPSTSQLLARLERPVSSLTELSGSVESVGDSHERDFVSVADASGRFDWPGTTVRGSSAFSSLRHGVTAGRASAYYDLAVARNVSGPDLVYTYGARAAGTLRSPIKVLVGSPVILRTDASVAPDAPDIRKVAWFDSTVSRLNALFEMTAGDDRHQSPDLAYAVQALGFFTDVLPRNAAPPSLATLEDGGIQAEWHRGGLDVEVLFSANPEERGIWIRNKATGEERDLPLTYEAFLGAVGDRLRADN